jgi:hypothetical protein
MDAGARISDDKAVFRGMSNQNWSKRGIVNYRAFMLRRESAPYPIEVEISLGLSYESAVDELREHFGVGELSVREIHALPHGLSTLQHPKNNLKAMICGLPLFSEDSVQRDRAITMATDLARICYLVPLPPIPNGVTHS